MTDKRDNEGAIWGNQKKQKETQPDFTGSATINGEDYWVSAWKRGENASERAPVLKFAFTKKDAPKDQAQYSGDAKPAEPDPVQATNNAIPF